MEIQELTGIIKQDVARLNGQIKDLETYLTSDSNSNPHIKEHSTGIVTSLRSQLASTSMSFKDVLEIRTQVNSNFDDCV